MRMSALPECVFMDHLLVCALVATHGHQLPWNWGLQMVMSSHVGPGKTIQVICKGSKYP